MRVTTRVVRDVGRLCARGAYQAVRRAVRTSLARADFRIVRLAVLPTRIELIVEANDKTALARGMQGFLVAAARYLNAACSRRGNVYPDRYRAVALRTRQQVRDAIAGLRGHRTTITAAWPASWLLRVELDARQRKRANAHAWRGFSSRTRPRRRVRGRVRGRVR